VAPPYVAPPGGVAPSLELSDQEFVKLCRLIHHYSGISLSSQKKELLRARLAKILRARGLVSFREYYQQVIEDRSGAKLTQLMDAISTNQTAFWREPAHFLLLSQEILPLWQQERRAGLNWRLWSAGCSSGEEPYTLAMALLDTVPEGDAAKVKIYASDLSTQMLAQARRGVYPKARVEPLPAAWRTRFFQKGVGEWEGYVRVKREVRSLLEFFHFNLMEAFPFKEELDLIFCRNVMIYFEKNTQMELVDKFHRCLRPGGYLFLGHSESLCNLQHRFTYVKPTVYRK
jgi:chemotaxis protein methyltransferase CheR